VYTYQELIKEDYSDSNIKHLSLFQKNILKLSLKNIDVIIQNPDEDEKEWKFSGRPFEVNIARASVLHNIPLREILLEEDNIYLPFNSSNKFSISKDGDRYTIMGAPDILLKMSNVDKDTYIKIMSWIQNASNDGKRLISVGTFESKNLEINKIKNIEFEGILSFFDPVREEVPGAVENIEAHGVRLVIITGDLKGTAISVAKSLGWKINDDEVLTGDDIHQMTDSQLLDVLKGIKIFARVTPEDKLRIGNLYRELGEVVAMTGDGVNDAPALKSMDIGISLGSSSDVAQSAADLVLLDDNFQTISMAIDEGRRILVSIRKAFVYLISNSMDMVFVIGGSLLFNMAIPFNALQIIWINLFTGSLPALAFAYDENLDKGIDKKSSKKDLLNTEVKILSFGIGTLSSVLIFLLYYFLLSFDIETKVVHSILFVCVSIYILLASFSFRSLYRPIYSYNPFSNKNLNIAVLIGFGILILTMSIPFMRDLFEIALLPLSFVWLVIAWGLFNIVLVEFTKFIFRLRLKYLHKDN